MLDDAGAEGRDDAAGAGLGGAGAGLLALARTLSVAGAAALVAVVAAVVAVDVRSASALAPGAPMSPATSNNSAASRDSVAVSELLGAAVCSGPTADVGKPANVATGDLVIVVPAGVGMEQLIDCIASRRRHPITVLRRVALDDSGAPAGS